MTSVPPLPSAPEISPQISFSPQTSCRCCGRHTYHPIRGRCGYCDAKPEQGGCLGYHGEALAAYLDDCCALGACTRDLANWWLS